MSSKEFMRNADTYSWEDILLPGGLSPVQSRNESGITHFTDWIHEDWPELRFRTYENEEQHIFRLKDDGTVDKSFVGTKYEAIRVIHFDKQTSIANRFVESQQPLSRTIFDELGEIRRDVFLENYGALSPKEKYWISPAFRTAVNLEVQRNDAKVEAQRIASELNFASERRTPSATPLDLILRATHDEPKYLIEGLFPNGGTCTIVASKKTGKSTFVYNFIYSLLHGEPLLGVFAAEKIDSRIGYVNYELTPRQCQEWFEKSPIGSSDQVLVWNLRGHPNPFRSESAMLDFAKEVRDLEIRVLILDPFSSAFSGTNSKDNDEVKIFWLMLDAFKEISGVRELLIPVHAGWEGSRSRGASTLEDHPDAIFYMTKESDGTRIFHAEGRDVLVEEGELSFDSSNLLLSYLGPNLRGTRVDRVAIEIVKLVSSRGRISATDLVRELRKNKDDVKQARDKLVLSGEIVCEQSGQAKFFSLPPDHSIAPSPTSVSGETMSVVAIASTPYKGDANANSEPICESCNGAKFEVFQESGIDIHSCKRCHTVVFVCDSPDLSQVVSLN